MTRRLKTPCSTPGCITSIHTGPRSFSVTVQMPLGVDLSSLTEEDLSDFHEIIHRHGEEIAYSMIKQSLIRAGQFGDTPFLRGLPPFAGQSDDDSNALEIIRRAAARMAENDPTLLDDEVGA